MCQLRLIAYGVIRYNETTKSGMSRKKAAEPLREYVAEFKKIRAKLDAACQTMQSDVMNKVIQLLQTQVTPFCWILFGLFVCLFVYLFVCLFVCSCLLVCLFMCVCVYNA